MPAEPSYKRTVTFVDGQNLFHGAREAFGYTHPNYDVKALAEAICLPRGWNPVQVRFYTGVPSPGDNAFWHRFWSAKLAHMGRQGIQVYSRPLRYRNKAVRLADGTEHTVLTGEEQGRWIKMASAYPVSPTTRNRRGIERTDWLPIDRGVYAACLDPRDYRSRPPGTS